MSPLTYQACPNRPRPAKCNELCSGQDFLTSQMKKVKVNCAVTTQYLVQLQEIRLQPIMDGLPWFPLPAAAGPICRYKTVFSVVLQPGWVGKSGASGSWLRAMRKRLGRASNGPAVVYQTSHFKANPGGQRFCRTD